MPTGSGSVIIAESVGSAAYVANSLEPKQSQPENAYINHPCTAAFQMIIPLIGKVYLFVKSSARGVQLVTLHKNLIKSHQALVAQGMMEIVPTHPNIIKMANCSTLQMLHSKGMKVRICLETATSWVNPQATTRQ